MAVKKTRASDESLDSPTPFNEMPKDMRTRVEALAAELKITDAASILQFGVSAQVRISEFSEQVLNQVRAKNVGQVRQRLAELLAKVKNLDLKRVGGPGFFERIPVLKHLRFTQNTLITHYEKINAELDKLVPELNASCTQLLKDVAFFDGLYARNLEHLRELDAFIGAGDRRLQKWTEEHDARAAKTNGADLNARDLEDRRDRQQQLECFGKRMQHLQMARMIALQLAPQIRLIQDDLKILVEETQNTVLTTIPLWKNQIVVAMAMMRQRATMRLTKHATQATTAMFAMNSDLIRSSSVLSADHESAKSAAERDTLTRAGGDLMATPTVSPRARAKRNGHGGAAKPARPRPARSRPVKTEQPADTPN